ncbi:MAG TPA: DUF1614 domain-containing protein [Clostridia bacterium]|nr:DUF1614 domain-containing protein [Clostridia bacterium]
MSGYPLGIILLIVVTILIYFGLAHRVLDRLRINDRTALLLLGAIIAGSFINIPITDGPPAVTVNVGGALIPFGLAVYLLAKAGTRAEWIRAIVATAITVVVITLVNRYLFADDPWRGRIDFIDPLLAYPIVAAVVAYLAGRSRRSAFVAATLGVLSLDVMNYIQLVNNKIPGRVAFGGGGAFDAVIMAGIGAVILAEIIGESRERLQGGPEKEGRPPELLESLDKAVPQPAQKPLAKEPQERKDHDAKTDE